MGARPASLDECGLGKASEAVRRAPSKEGGPFYLSDPLSPLAKRRWSESCSQTKSGSIPRNSQTVEGSPRSLLVQKATRDNLSSASASCLNYLGPTGGRSPSHASPASERRRRVWVSQCVGKVLCSVTAIRTPAQDESREKATGQPSKPFLDLRGAGGVGSRSFA